MTPGTEIKVRLISYKSFRHYGGREIASTPNVCRATFIKQQTDLTILVELLEPCDGFKAGHKIAVLPKDFNIQ